MAAILQYLAICPEVQGPLFILIDSHHQSTEHFVKDGALLAAAKIDQQGYSRLSSQISAGTLVAQARLPGHIITILGHWNSDTYLLYIHTTGKFGHCSPSHHLLGSGKVPTTVLVIH